MIDKKLIPWHLQHNICVGISFNRAVAHHQKQCCVLQQRENRVNSYQQQTTNTVRKHIWVRGCICTITLLMAETMKMARVEDKRISKNMLELRTPHPSSLKHTASVLKWRGERELKGRRKSILNISFQSNVNNLCCLCFLLLLFIYLLLSLPQPVRFSKASRRGKLYQTFEFSFKRLSPRLFIYFSSFTLVLLFFGEANTWHFDEKHSYLLTPRKSK